MSVDMKSFNWDLLPMMVTATANPAAGADAATIVVPAGKRWVVLSFSQSMVTAVAVANRYPYVQHRTAGGAILGQYMAATPQTASLTVGWSFGNNPAGGIVANNAFKCESMPEFECAAGDLLNFYWLNLQAADDGGIVYCVYKEVSA